MARLDPLIGVSDRWHGVTGVSPSSTAPISGQSLLRFPDSAEPG
jgi:hypothetical protein